MTWKLGGRKVDAAPDAVDDNAEGHNDEADMTGKGRPTPKRREAERRKLHPMVPTNRKASAKEAKKRIRQQEDAQYDAMRSGDLAHMPVSERLPWRVYIRDYVDARINVAEFFMPVAFAVIIVSMLLASTFPKATSILLLLLYVYLFAAIIDIFLMWRKLKRLLIAKFGERSVGKGSRSATYAWSRCLQIRRWRLPKPKYGKRGHWPD